MGSHPERLETRVRLQRSRCSNSGNDDQQYVVQTGKTLVSIRRAMVHRKRHSFLGWPLDSDPLCLLLLLISGLRLRRGGSPRADEWPFRPVSRLSLRTTPAGSICRDRRDSWPGKYLERRREVALSEVSERWSWGEMENSVTVHYGPGVSMDVCARAKRPPPGRGGKPESPVGSKSRLTRLVPSSIPMLPRPSRFRQGGRREGAAVLASVRVCLLPTR